MKPQETALERAEKYVAKQMKALLWGVDGGAQITTKICEEWCRKDFIAGEESGERIALERLAVDYETGKKLSHEDMFRLVKHHQKAAEINLNEASSLRSKIELLEKEGKEKDEMIRFLRTRHEDISNFKRDHRIKTLESALVDMAKALEIATTYGLPPHDVSGREAWLSIYETKKLHQELLSEIGRDGK